MPQLARIVVQWSGAAIVGPGVTVTHCASGDESTALTALNTFFTAVKTQVPIGVTWSFPTTGDLVDEASNTVVGTWLAGAVGPITSTGSSSGFVNGVGGRCKLFTTGIVNGRRVTGAIYVVPLIAAAYEGAGNLTAGAISALGGAANNLGLTANALRIYSRPSPTHPTGVSFATNAGTCLDFVSWLRSRRT